MIHIITYIILIIFTALIGYLIIKIFFRKDFRPQLITIDEKINSFNKRFELLLQNNQIKSLKLQELENENLKLKKQLENEEMKVSIKPSCQIDETDFFNKLIIHELILYGHDQNNFINLLELVNLNVIQKYLLTKDSENQQINPIKDTETSSPFDSSVFIELEESINKLFSKFFHKNIDIKKVDKTIIEELYNYMNGLNDKNEQLSKLNESLETKCQRLNADLLTLNGEFLNIRKENDHKIESIKVFYSNKLNQQERIIHDDASVIKDLKLQLNEIRYSFVQNNQLEAQLDSLNKSFNDFKTQSDERLSFYEHENKSMVVQLSKFKKSFDELIIEKDMYKKKYLDIVNKYKREQASPSNNSINSSTNVSRYSFVQNEIVPNRFASETGLNPPSLYTDYDTQSNTSNYRANSPNFNSVSLMSLPPPPVPPQEIIDYFMNCDPRHINYMTVQSIENPSDMMNYPVDYSVANTQYYHDMALSNDQQSINSSGYIPTDNTQNQQNPNTSNFV